ncbi:hypothetical protein [Rhodoferax antarcticus]|uniref:hypothetical protein n=1 Tax=Rhodoferax antarcticus TaxID=81479 RepID=UPI000B0F44E3|nr:hypothetical protein [Rhodoferax antarcticus]
MHPSPAEIEKIYSDRKAQVAGLAAKGSISVQDIQALTRHGRFQVADELWTICDEGAKKALISDEHHHVRSAAILH